MPLLMTTGCGCHFFAYQSNSHALLNKRKMHRARILQTFLKRRSRIKYVAISNMIIQLKGDNKNDKTEEATWCML
jgi:hypothetical protein